MDILTQIPRRFNALTESRPVSANPATALIIDKPSTFEYSAFSTGRQMTRFFSAPEAQEIGLRLMHEHHKHLLINAVRVDFIFRDDTPKAGGNEVWGTARKVTGMNAYLSNMTEDGEAREYFVITLSYPIWDDLTERQREALIDHELMHCGVKFDENDEMKLVLIGHDFEGFAAEIDRHGLWRTNALVIAQAMRPHLQLSLFESKKVKSA